MMHLILISNNRVNGTLTDKLYTVHSPTHTKISNTIDVACITFYAKHFYVPFFLLSLSDIDKTMFYRISLTDKVHYQSGSDS